MSAADPGRRHWLKAVGHARGPMSQQSHISITASQYERAVDALASIAR